MNEEYDVIVLGTGLTVSEYHLIQTRTFTWCKNM